MMHRYNPWLVVCLLLFNTHFLWAQTITVTGKVSDAKATLPGVSVVVKGTQRGTTTNADGNYSLTVDNPNSTLVFSFVGYDSQEVPLNGRTNLDVRLAEAANTLQEVVAVGYGTQRRETVTSSITRVGQENFNKGYITSPNQLLQGKVAGLAITRPAGNDPNAGAAVIIRGINTVNGSSAPLYIVDGVPVSSIAQIAPNDVETVDVLKDGSAAAIYGTRGTNGVIIITTKRGKDGAPTVDYSTFVGVEQITRRPEVLNRDEYLKALNDNAAFLGLNPADINRTYDFGSNTDWFKLLVRDAVQQQHTISMAGGTAKTNYRISLNYQGFPGVVNNTFKNTLFGRISVNHRALNDKLSVQLNVANTFINRAFTNYGYFEQAINLNPTYPVYNPDGSFYQPNGFAIYNPVAAIDQTTNERKDKVTLASVRPVLEVLPGLLVGTTLALEREDRIGGYYETKGSRPSIESGRNGFASRSTLFDYTKTLELTTTYDRSFGEHTVGALAGYSYQNFIRETFDASNSFFLTDAFTYNNLGAGAYNALGRAGMGSGKYETSLVAFFGRVNYSYANKYLLSASVRREGSTKFGANYKWGTFPAISGGWRIAGEDFMKSVPAVSELKVRVGYGVTGNQGGTGDNLGLAPYQSLQLYGPGAKYAFGSATNYVDTYGPSVNPNPDLRWETKAELNAGIDFGLFNNRLSGTIDYYVRNTRDLIYSYGTQVPPFIFNSITTNVGTLRNNGIEVTLNVVPIQKEKFSWNSNLNFSYNKNVLAKFSNDQYKRSFVDYSGLPAPGNLGNVYRLQEGYPVASFYGKRFKGFTDQGKWIFEDLDGDGNDRSDKDKTFIGNGTPKFNAGFNNTINYGNFTLNLYFRGAFGFDILNLKNIYYGNRKYLPTNVLRSALDNPIRDDPQYSDYYLEKGSYVKLDNVTLTYNIPVPQNKYVRNASVFVSALNTLTFTGYSGIDPELNISGLEHGRDNRDYYPRTRSLSVGLNVGF